jgi:hypothetical protein
MVKHYTAPVLVNLLADRDTDVDFATSQGKRHRR